MKKKIFNIVAIMAVFCMAFFTGNLLAGFGITEDDDTGLVKVERDKDEGELAFDRLNVLLMGVDARPGEKDARTDSLVVVSMDKETGKIAMLSIPRDTYVNIPGYGKDRINAANLFGGPELAVRVVEDLVGLEIPYYVKTNFDGFKDIVDTLGGVTIDVDKNMYYRDGKDVINLKKGEQRLNGDKALQYVRYRNDALGDITRTERQQNFLAALADEILKAKTIVKLPKLLPQIFKVVDTNFGVKDIFFLTRLASSFDSQNIVAQTLPGTFFNYKGASYWQANEQKSKLVINDMLKGVTTAAVVDPPVNVPKEKPKPEPKPEPEPVPQPKPETDSTVDNNKDKPKVDVNIGPVPNPVKGTDKENPEKVGDQNNIQPDPNKDGGGTNPGTGTNPPNGTSNDSVNGGAPSQPGTGGVSPVESGNTSVKPPSAGTVSIPPAAGTTGATTS